MQFGKTPLVIILSRPRSRRSRCHSPSGQAITFLFHFARGARGSPIWDPRNAESEPNRLGLQMGIALLGAIHEGGLPTRAMQPASQTSLNYPGSKTRLSVMGCLSHTLPPNDP